MSANQKQNPENETFYQELDEKTRRRSCCNCSTMIILFLIVSLLAIALTIFLFGKIRGANLENNFLPKKLETLSDKFVLGPENNPTFTLTVTENELTAASGGELAVGGWQIKNLEFKIDELMIEVDGQLVKIFKFNLKIFSLPEVVDGKVKLKIQKISAGGLGMPGFFRVEMEKALNNLLDKNFASIYENYQVTDIKLNQDEMLISGKLKK